MARPTSIQAAIKNYSLDFTQRGTYSSQSNAVSYNDTSVSIGSANKWRWVLVMIAFRSNTSPANGVASVQVGGVALSNVVDGPASAKQQTAFAYGKIPEGTSGNIVVTLNKTADGCSFATYTFISSSGNPLVDYDSDNGDPTASVDLVTVRDGAVAGAVVCFSASGFTWNNGLTESYDASVDSARGGAGYDTDESASSARTVSVTATGASSGQNTYLTAVSLRPN